MNARYAFKNGHEYVHFSPNGLGVHFETDTTFVQVYNTVTEALVALQRHARCSAKIWNLQLVRITDKIETVEEVL